MTKPLALQYDQDEVIRDQASMIGQLQTQVFMRDSALRTAHAEIERLKEQSRSARPADTQGD